MPDSVITAAERSRTAERLRAVIVAVGSRARLCALLGYPSDNSLRQAEQGNTTLPDAALVWLKLRPISPGALRQTSPATGRS